MPNKVLTFLTGNTTFKLQGKDKEIIAVSLMRDLFGSTLSHSLKQRIEVWNFHWLRYVLFLQVLMEVWKKYTQSKAITETGSRYCICSTSKHGCNNNRWNVFLAFVSRSIIHICSITRYIVGSICSTTSREIHFVFDKIIHPSIKDCAMQQVICSSQCPF